MDGVAEPFTGDYVLYGFRKTPHGLAAIAVSGRGLAAVLLGSDRGGLRRRLAEALPGAVLMEDGSGIDEDAALGGILDAVERHLARPETEPGFELDLRGSADELAVWNALREIPSGETRSYGAIASRVGGGVTAQAVGAACASNRIAIVVPCHRVIKADGSVSGYRWGVERKRRLLAMEAAA